MRLSLQRKTRGRGRKLVCSSLNHNCNSQLQRSNRFTQDTKSPAEDSALLEEQILLYVLGHSIHSNTQTTHFHTKMQVTRRTIAVLVPYAFSMSCSRSCTFLQSSSARGKLLPTFMNRAAILLLRRNPAALRFKPYKTQASTAAATKQRRY